MVGSTDALSGANSNPRSPTYADVTLSGHTDSVPLQTSGDDDDVNGDGLDADELDNLRSVSMTSSMNSFSVDGEEEEEDESTYAFSTLDSDFIAWMRLSVKDVTVEHPCYSSRQSESLASLTRQELLKVVNVFNSNLLGLQMTLSRLGHLFGID
ncbi:unnamed protein product [Dibothriocephalus latus]|uniref:Uncharacterized protein n=1 Tax=Dibothriocephalus latus TaxID=60516 RepID=A0A3P7MDE1_DIBLA|nr:unnamed protein product [Dibothriocephalus latus]